MIIVVVVVETIVVRCWWFPTKTAMVNPNGCVWRAGVEKSKTVAVGLHRMSPPWTVSCALQQYISCNAIGVLCGCSYCEHRILQMVCYSMLEFWKREGPGEADILEQYISGGADMAPKTLRLRQSPGVNLVPALIPTSSSFHSLLGISRFLAF